MKEYFFNLILYPILIAIGAAALVVIIGVPIYWGMKFCGLYDYLDEYQYYIPVKYFSFPSRIDRAIEKHDYKEASTILSEMSKTEDAKKWYQTDGWDFKNQIVDSKYSIELEKVIYSCSSYIINESEDDNETSEMILSLLKQWDHPTHRVGKIKQFSESVLNNEYYNQSVEKYNSLIKNIIDLAIVSKKEHLALVLVPMLKASLKKSTAESHFLDPDIYEYTYDFHTKDEIQEIVNKAVKRDNHENNDKNQ